MNSHDEGSVGRGTKGLGWLVRCKSGCEGIVKDGVPRIGDPCPLCSCAQQNKARLTYCVRIAAAGDAYEEVSLEGGISLEGDLVQPWDVDIGSFLTCTDSENSTLTLGNGTRDLSGTLVSVTEGNEPEKAHVSKVQVPQEGTILQSLNATENEIAQSPEREQHNIEDNDSPDSLDLIDGVRFGRWHVLGLICCAALLLIGGLLTFDIVRALNRPGDTTIASPILRVLR